MAVYGYFRLGCTKLWCEITGSSVDDAIEYFANHIDRDSLPIEFVCFFPSVSYVERRYKAMKPPQVVVEQIS